MGDFNRTWDFATDGVLDGHYLGLRQVPTSNGNAPIADFELDNGEQVSVWLSATVLKNRFVDELTARNSDDFETNERIRIERGGKGISNSGNEFWNFSVNFEHGAAPRSAREILLGGRQPTPAPTPAASPNGYSAGAGDDDIPF